MVLGEIPAFVAACFCVLFVLQREGFEVFEGGRRVATVLSEWGMTWSGLGWPGEQQTARR